MKSRYFLFEPFSGSSPLFWMKGDGERGREVEGERGREGEREMERE